MCAEGCEPVPQRSPPASRAATREATSSVLTAVPESAWVVVSGPTIVAFHPAKSNVELDADTALAIALDDLSYHLGSAMDSLVAAGYRVQYSSGDTVWLRTVRLSSRFVREPDSATVGYVFTDALGRRAVIYGVRTYVDLVEYAHEFKRTGAIASR